MTLYLLPSLVVAQMATTTPATLQQIDLSQLDACEDSLDVAIFNVPRYPHRKAPLTILVASEPDVGEAAVLAQAPDGQQTLLPTERFGGPPWGFVARVERPKRGKWRFALVNAEGVKACQDVKVRRAQWGDDSLKEGAPAWRARIKWERDTENLYSLWIEHLFRAPAEAEISWRPLSKVLRDPTRNLLHGYLGLDEDADGKDGLRAKPDCADFPYYLRGYFAWKLGLPFAFRPCRRGDAKRAPRCSEEFITNELTAESSSRKEAFERFILKMQGIVHSSSLRSLPQDEKSDFYPVALSRQALRPGTIYTDPYGHTMMVGSWFPQNGDQAGILMAIDAQPDGTIGRRRFWRGSFMFPEDDALAGAGWKRFRPVRRVREGYEVFSNSRIARSPDYGDFSVAQWESGKDAFYESMDALITPEPLSPAKALEAIVDNLDQQIRRRIESVDNGEQWIRKHRGKTMKMPKGPAIFITSGPWEDYSTPSRDMRLLIAMDTVTGFPQRIRKVPHRFRLQGRSIAEQEQAMSEMLAQLTSAKTYRYTRSDGSQWTLTMADILARATAFETAYNPNDCVEHRWGAPEGSDERSTCQRKAPKSHWDKMNRYRPWFQKRERPASSACPRGICRP